MSTIFICDAETETVRYLDKLLLSSGYQVETFTSGADLLGRLEQAADMPCDVILQDVHMPDMDGLQILDRLCKR